MFFESIIAEIRLVLADINGFCMTIQTLIETRTGELAALATVLCWTMTCLSSEYVSKRASALVMNVFRMYLSFILFAVFSFFIRNGKALPTDATSFNWIWLSVSGLIGFVIGDLFLLKSFSIIGSRTSMLIMSLVPLFTSIIGYFFLHDTLKNLHIIGMIITTFGVSLVILTREKGTKQFKHPIKGIIYATIGMLGQAIGLIFSKYGMDNDYNAFASTHIRIIAGLAGFTLIALYIKPWKKMAELGRQPKLMFLIVVSTFFGTFLGIFLSLLAIKETSIGIASTIMAIVPVTIIPFSFFFFKEKINLREIIGAIIAVIGTGIMFW